MAIFGNELADVLAQIKATNTLLSDVLRSLRNIEESLIMLPRCNCSDHQEGESWTCAIHGLVVRTKSR